jgi:signal transduction histidine kinase/ActR/RegA family two-component response regulator
LLLLIFFAVVPSFGLILYTAWEARRAAAIELQAELLRSARLVSTHHERLVEGVRHLLVGLAQLREVLEGDGPACSAIMADLLHQHPAYANLAAVAPDGRVFCSALPVPASLSVTDRAYFRRAVETRRFVAGDYQIGRATMKPTINFAYPVYHGDTEPRAILVAAVDLAWLNHVSARATWPAGSTVTVFDGNGTVLARHGDPQRQVGTSAAAEPSFRALRAGGEGTFEAAGLDGKRKLFAFASLGGIPESSPVYCVVGIPKAAAFAGIDRALRFNLLALALVTAAGLAAACIIGELTVLKHARGLVAATRRIAAGDLAVRTNLSRAGELGELAAAFDDMAERLEARAAEAARAQAEILQQRAALYQTEKIAGMGSLLAGVAHELSNPLSVVLGRTGLLRQLAGSGPMAPQADKIADAAERCARIMRNFLGLARHQAPERQPTQLNDVVKNAVELVAYPLRVDAVEVVLELTPELPVLLADPHQLHQVVVNLVTNAHYAMREAAPPRRLTVTTRFDPERVVLEIVDTGPGIPPELHARIFEPFFTTKPAGQGTGLGLSLCQGIVESHDGEICVQSALGRGTRFVVTLPARSAAAGGDLPPALELPIVRCKRVLVVDDEAEVAAILADLLRLDGHLVDTACNGLAAIDKLAGQDFDLIVSDVRMPGLDGAGLYRAVQDRRPHLLSRFVFVTGDALSADTAVMLARTGAPTITKPFDMRDVRRVIQHVLGKADEAEAAAEETRAVVFGGAAAAARS